MTRPAVRPVQSRSDRRRFIHLPWRLYRDDPHWTPPILASHRQLLGYASHPFYDQAEAQTFIAERDGRITGRISAIVNRAHNHTHNEQRGFFGFFECEEDVDSARALFDAGERWLAERGQTAVRGPVNPSQNYECGLLVEGFDSPSAFMMPYHKPYYRQLVEACGYAGAQNLLAFTGHIDMLPGLIEKYGEPVRRALDTPNLMIRPLDRRHFLRDVMTYLEIYNRSLEHTWGFVPLSASEVRHIARDLRHLIVPEFTAYAEVDGKTIGALFYILDYNPLIRRIDGRLLPFGFLSLLGRRRKLTNLRALATTVMPDYQRTGLVLLMMSSLAQPAVDWGIRTAEFSWVLESNGLACGSLRRAGLDITRTWRIYDKPI